MLPEISDKEIEYAENILFAGKGKFDQERLNFIKNFETLDLQAVPGSGKTTVLLAKLLILEKHLPLKDGQGILIVSHTNVAIDEIIARIGAHCPKLFGYPNFIGTIQNFVNKFLAVPFFEHHFRSKIIRIDNEIYQQEIEQSLKLCLKGKDFDTFKKVKHIQNTHPDLIYSYRLDRVNDEIILLNKLNGSKLSIEKPRGKTNKDKYKDYSAEEKTAVTEYLKLLKTKCLRSGILHYDDAYFLAKAYINTIPTIKKHLRLRFPMVFIDEMQDMERHQHDLLELLFHDENPKSCYQRIGDINQCIFGENSSSMEEVWHERKTAITISGSHRLHKNSAKIIQCFGARKSVPILGLNDGENLNPHLILYKPASINNVISTFGDLILDFQTTGEIDGSEKYPIKVIGWNGKPSEDGKLRIGDYYPDYQTSEASQRIDFLNLYCYLIYYDREKQTLESIRKNILNGVLRLLRMENITSGDRYFTKRTFLNYLKFTFPDHYNKFQEVLYLCCISCIRTKVEDAHKMLIDFLPSVLKSVFKIDLDDVGEKFLLGTTQLQFVKDPADTPNVFQYKSLSMTIGTVHSVKGETHTATLYLDTCYHKLESEKSINQLIGKEANLEKMARRLESAKMMYVGFSRATHLLCYAAELGRLDDHEEDLIQAGWKIIRI